MAIEGLDTVLNNLRNAIELLREKARVGLVSAQAKIHDDMESISPKVPQDLKNLTNSYFCVDSDGTVVEGNSPLFDNKRKDAARMQSDHTSLVTAYRYESMLKKTAGTNVIFGFTAYYSAIVHEMVNSPGRSPINWTRLGSGPKFFEAALKRNSNIISTIAKQMKLPK